MPGIALRRLVVVLAAGTLVAAGGRGGAATLEIGSPAPAIDVAHWFEAVGGATPIRDFEPGKIYVVEFWATWCGPCRTSIPRLAEIQKRYAGRGVTVIGVSDEEVAEVEAFLAKESGDTTFAELTRTYRLGVDPDGSVNTDYMQAAGQDGIPIAFIVGRRGEIEWIGHPLRMNEQLEQVVAGTWDRAAHAAEVKERAAALAPAEGNVLDTLAHLLALAGDLPAAIAAQRQAAAHAGDQAEQINAYLQELEARAGAK